MMIKAIIVAVLLSSVGGLYWYVDHLQQANLIHEVNAVNSASAIKSLKETIEFEAADKKVKQAQVADKQKQLSRLHLTNANLNKRLNEVTITNEQLKECLVIPLPNAYIDELRNSTSQD